MCSFCINCWFSSSFRGPFTIGHLSRFLCVMSSCGAAGAAPVAHMDGVLLSTPYTRAHTRTHPACEEMPSRVTVINNTISSSVIKGRLSINHRLTENSSNEGGLHLCVMYQCVFYTSCDSVTGSWWRFALWFNYSHSFLSLSLALSLFLPFLFLFILSNKHLPPASQDETVTEIAVIIQLSVGFELKGCVIMNQYTYPAGGQLFIVPGHCKVDIFNISSFEK